MGVRDSHGEAAGTPDPVEKGIATLNTIRYVAQLDIIIFRYILDILTPKSSVAYAK
jgi:hypothetical protein